MDKKAQMMILAVAVVAVVAVAGIVIIVNQNNGNNSDSPIIPDVPMKDFAGYDVTPVSDLNNGIVAIGQDTFRWVTYFGLADKCVMVDLNDTSNYMAKAFMYVGKTQALNANPSGLANGKSNCAITDEDVGKIIDLNPSVIVVPVGFETEYKKQMDALRLANLHIVHIGYIYSFLEPQTFNMTEDLDKQINILSKTFCKEDRGVELKKAFIDIVKDIRNIASKVTQKKTGYVGCLAYNGAHGADSSAPYFIPFELANVTNILANEHTSEESGVDVYSADKINGLMKEDTVLFLDATGIFKVAGDNTSIGILKLFSGHEAYVSYPYIWTGINYEDVLICAYQILHDTYYLLTDNEFQEKMNNVHKAFLGSEISNRIETVSKKVEPPTAGTTIYDDMSQVYSVVRGNPTHAAINVADDGSLTFHTNNHGNIPADLKDFAGYDVTTVSDFSNGIVAIGQDTFRWVTYFGFADKCVMVDLNDTSNYMAKAFMYVGKTQALNANPGGLANGKSNCAITDEDVGTIIDLNPAVVVVPMGFETEYKKQMDALRSANLHIVHIGYIYSFLKPQTFEITDDLDKQINVLAKTFGDYTRGQEIREAFNDIVKDIRSIASAVTQKKTGYVGCLAYNGAHGADSSAPYFIPFELANITNILANEQTTEESGVDVFSADKINGLMSEDTVLFLDATGIFKVAGDNTSVGILKLFSGHEAYISYPYIWTGINYEDVLICAYQMLHDAYGLLSDDELQEKVKAVHEAFLGTDISNRIEIVSKKVDPPAENTTIYDDMSQVYSIVRGNATHGSITVNDDGTLVFN
ncbi:MAG: hypothetical protein IJT54_07945 [Candidatus Methanomethylophilaceae archaeon]|nr:hypothetical protein [Candidatus Methanomethylophilaceae archaeon]